MFGFCARQRFQSVALVLAILRCSLIAIVTLLGYGVWPRKCSPITSKKFPSSSNEKLSSGRLVRLNNKCVPVMLVVGPTGCFSDCYMLQTTKKLTPNCRER
jgi:hypothetical protein